MTLDTYYLFSSEMDLDPFFTDCLKEVTEEAIRISNKHGGMKIEVLDGMGSGTVYLEVENGIPSHSDETLGLCESCGNLAEGCAPTHFVAICPTKKEESEPDWGYQFTKYFPTDGV